MFIVFPFTISFTADSSVKCVRSCSSSSPPLVGSVVLAVRGNTSLCQQTLYIHVAFIPYTVAGAVVHGNVTIEQAKNPPEISKSDPCWGESCNLQLWIMTLKILHPAGSQKDWFPSTAAYWQHWSFSFNETLKRGLCSKNDQVSEMILILLTSCKCHCISIYLLHIIDRLVCLHFPHFLFFFLVENMQLKAEFSST